MIEDGIDDVGLMLTMTILVLLTVVLVPLLVPLLVSHEI